MSRTLRPPVHAVRSPGRRRHALCRGGLALLALCAVLSHALASEMPEYRVKAAFIYNFVLYTEWPGPAGAPAALNVCIVGDDPFGAEIDGLQGKEAAGRRILVHRAGVRDPLGHCQLVFVAASAIGALPALLEGVRGLPVLTVADSVGAMRSGVVLNLGVTQGRVTFEANLRAARSAGLQLSSRLLRLATEVLQ